MVVQIFGLLALDPGAENATGSISPSRKPFTAPPKTLHVGLVFSAATEFLRVAIIKMNIANVPAGYSSCRQTISD